MGLFRVGSFALHSGSTSSFKIDCDALTDEDLHALAAMFAERRSWSAVEGVPTGGIRFARALATFAGYGPLLIADDVLTTGASMEEQRADRNCIGVVIFARGPCPTWVTPLFDLTPLAWLRAEPD